MPRTTFEPKTAFKASIGGFVELKVGEMCSLGRPDFSQIDRPNRRFNAQKANHYILGLASFFRLFILIAAIRNKCLKLKLRIASICLIDFRRLNSDWITFFAIFQDLTTSFFFPFDIGHMKAILHSLGLLCFQYAAFSNYSHKYLLRYHPQLI